MCFKQITSDYYLVKVSWYFMTTFLTSSELFVEYTAAKSWYAWLNGLINLPTTCEVYLGTLPT